LAVSSLIERGRLDEMHFFVNPVAIGVVNTYLPK
jgi:hypothetical protein